MLQKVGFYLNFLLKGVSKYNIHSPLIHDLVENVLDKEKKFYSFIGIEHLRALLLKDASSVFLHDLGKGSTTIRGSKIKVKTLTKKVQSRPEKAQILFKLVNFYNSNNILEIGTSLGLTTAYLSNANKNSSVTTLEGDPSIYLMAKKNFQKLGLKNVTLHHGDFDNLLPKIFTQKFDFIFFDGNHSKKATLKYFNWALENFMEEAIYVFDDIYWSKEMKEAWTEISNHPKVMMSLDIFSLGIIFFKKNREKEHINLIHSCNFY